MIGRVQDRATFEELRRHGRRVRRGPVTVVYLAADEPPARAAFAIGRKVGNAVTRNRVRRRLRAILRDLDRAAPEPGLPFGTYLVTGQPAIVELPYGTLSELVGSACAAVVSPDRSAR